MEGIDISSYQGSIDWTKIKTDFIYIKLSQGVHAHDQKVLEYAVNAQKINVPFGYYHFATLNSSDVVGDATIEVNDVVTHLKTLPAATLALALDIETNDEELQPPQIEEWIHSFMNGIKAAGHKVILYSGLYWLNENLPQQHTCGKYPLWIAEYSKATVPILPIGWTDYNIWQYSSVGAVPGISGKVDLNRAKILI